MLLSIIGIILGIAFGWMAWMSLQEPRDRVTIVGSILIISIGVIISVTMILVDFAPQLLLEVIQN